MPRLACWACGRQIYTVSPIQSLFVDERRCPRCGAYMNADRRETERRTQIRRQNPASDPGPSDETGERRIEERRRTRRRRGGNGSGGGGGPRRSDTSGWAG